MEQTRTFAAIDRTKTGTAADPATGTIFFIGNATVLVRWSGFAFLTDPTFIHKHEQTWLGYGLHTTRLTDPAIVIEDLLLNCSADSQVDDLLSMPYNTRRCVSSHSSSHRLHAAPPSCHTAHQRVVRQARLRIVGTVEQSSGSQTIHMARNHQWGEEFS